MKFEKFSKKQMAALLWWCDSSVYKDKDAIICDGAVRSGKTFSLSLSFVLWAFCRFTDASFGICSKTLSSLRRNLLTPLVPMLEGLGFEVTVKQSENLVIIKYKNRVNRFYLFSGKDESSQALIQGVTLCGVLLDEVVLMPRSFVEQALSRCSVNGSKFFFNCNPQYPSHWFFNEWIKKAKEKNALYIHFTMQDNPSLSQNTIDRYERMYSGAFYERFVKGRWVNVCGAVYPFMDNFSAFYDVPQTEFEEYAVSCDYGIVNPCSFGLWGRTDDIWYRIDEYYFDSKAEGFQRTDEEHYKALCELVKDRKLSFVTVDPSASSFIEVIKRHDRYSVIKAKNDVLDGIRCVASLLKDKRIRICNNCTDAMREFSLYRYKENSGHDAVIKSNDHAMDDIRYFVTTINDRNDDGFAVVAAVRN